MLLRLNEWGCWRCRLRGVLETCGTLHSSVRSHCSYCKVDPVSHREILDTLFSLAGICPCWMPGCLLLLSSLCSWSCWVCWQHAPRRRWRGLLETMPRFPATISSGWVMTPRWTLSGYFSSQPIRREWWSLISLDGFLTPMKKSVAAWLSLESTWKVMPLCWSVTCLW